MLYGWTNMLSSDAAVTGVPSGSYPLRVAYDAKAFVDDDRGTGKGAYLHSLLGTLGFAFTGLASRGTRNAPFPLWQRGTPRYLVWQQTWLPAMLYSLRPQVFVAPNNTAPLLIPSGVKLISVVHDLILFESFPEATLRRRLRDRYRAWLLRRTIEQSSLVLTNSRNTADAVEQRFPGKRLQVIYCTVEASWYVRQNVVPRSGREPYVLIVTSNVPHKNIPRALQAFAEFKALDAGGEIKLRMVGVSGSAAPLLDMAEKVGIREAVGIEPYLNETELQQLYRRALCVFVPSRMEGFGIPALEAMASGTPLASSNTWSLPEVGGDAAFYFDPLQPHEMAQALLHVCRDAPTWERLSKAGLERAELFHPSRVQAEAQKFWETLPDLYRSW
jgi:glycosyltransferase involved in cell wall biosynthesis